MSKMKLFVHLPKNGGMSIRHSSMTGPLKGKVKVCTPDTHKAGHANSVKLTMDRQGDHSGWEHIAWRNLNDEAKKLQAFAVIRNPWDRVVSRYFFAKKVIEVEKKVPTSYADISSFEAFLEERHKWGGVKYMEHRAVRGWYPAMEHVTDEDGNVKCDMMRLEHLNKDVEKYFGIDKMSKARNVTALNTGTYRDIYTPETIQIVADWYAKDIDHWGFDFDTTATKNYWNIL